MIIIDKFEMTTKYIDDFKSQCKEKRLAEIDSAYVHVKNIQSIYQTIKHGLSKEVRDQYFEHMHHVEHCFDMLVKINDEIERG